MNTIQFKWSHRLPTKRKNGKSVCQIISLEKISADKFEKTVMYEATQICHKLDAFNRKKGLKMSFEKAVSQIESKQIRTEYWERFIKEHKSCLI